MSRTWKRFLSLLLVTAMILSLTVTGLAAGDPADPQPAEESSGVEVGLEKVDNDTISNRLPLKNPVQEADVPEHADDEIVRVSIVLEGLSALDAGYAPSAAKGYRSAAKAQQDALANKISAEVLGGEKLDVVWNITLAANIISANVPFGKIDAIRNTVGVRDVVLENLYLPEADQPNNGNATQMTAAVQAWDLGYTGAGGKVAIVDTGLDTDHQSFSAAGFEYAIEELDAKRAEEGKAPVDLLTEDEVAAVWDQLNAAAFIGSVDGVYRDAKVPFGVNYVDRDLDITHDNDGQGEHGSHVAGIAAANKYIPDGEGGFDRALDAVKMQGEAPDAQLIIMKVFGRGGGAYDSDYMIAIEDAIVLGADSVNLSLGSSSAGYTTDDTYAEILNGLTATDIIWANSAGNNYDWTEASYGALYEDDVNYHTGGSPGTYNNTISVASIDNTGVTGTALQLADGTNIFYNESSGYGNEPITSIIGTHPYILVTTPGNEEADFAALAEVLEGKIGVCSRGSSSFYVKANASAGNGAVATIIYNNQPGTINMNLTGYNFSAPCVSITQADGYLMRLMGEQKELNGVTYYEGTISVSDELISQNMTPAYMTMSDFSSWGGNGALTMKPEITAPGGDIWSVNGAIPGGQAYEIMGGTSMASPQIAGLAAVVKQYIREEGLVDKLGLSERQIAQSLLMSTAVPVLDAYSGYYYSVLKQGSGLANANNAITARSFVQVVDVPDSAPLSAIDSIGDGKVKIEVGEVYNGFSAAFKLTNFSDEDISFYLDGDLFTQEVSDGCRWQETVPVYAALSWTVNGASYEPLSLAYDFNGDGVSNGQDAQALLNWCADDSLELNNLAYADLDNDGDVDTADAKLAFEMLNGVATVLPAGESAIIGVTAEYDMSEYDEVNGNYIEGFLFIHEGDTDDGALGVEHSIPVYGFNGNFTNANMFDRGSLLEYYYEYGDGDAETGVYPYMLWAVYNQTSDVNSAFEMLDVETFYAKYPGENAEYALAGNPFAWDNEYYPERNAINGENGTSISSVGYSLIRNTAAARFFVTDQYGRELSSMDLPGQYAAYYYRNQATWMNTQSSAKLNYIPRNVKEGTELTLNYQVAPEYYVDSDGYVDWDALGLGTYLSMPVTIDNTAPDIVTALRDTVEATDEEEGSDTLYVVAHDNQYIAAVVLWTEDGDLIDYYGGLDGVLRGQQISYPFDISENEDPHLLVQVYDYAMNLSTYKVNFNAEEEINDELSVELDEHEALIIGLGTLKLTAAVYPWGLVDEALTWESDNEAVAVVDDDGMVTGVGEGEALITATSLVDPTKSDSCLITVKFIDKDLSGIVWDEDGQVWFADFNLNAIPDYTKLNAANLRLPIASLTYDENGVLYGASFDTEDLVSSLYTIDEETWEATEIGPSEIGYMDICAAPSLGDNTLLGVYGSYVVIIDKESGDYLGAFNFGRYGANNLVGIAYEEQYFHPSYGNTDWVWLVDDAGNLFNAGFLPYNGSYANFTPSNLGNLGYSTDTPYFQSLYYDGESLYWSRYSAAENDVDIIMVDSIYTDGSIYNTGSFADNVWPVGGLFERGIIPALGFAGLEHADAEIDSDAVFETEIAPIFGAADEAPVADGGLNAINVNPEEVEEEGVVIQVTADELSNNGKLIVTYDPATAKLERAFGAGQFRALFNDELLGKVVYAFVDLDGIAADAAVLNLVFSEDSTGTVSIVKAEANNEHPETETLITLPVGEELEEHEHAFGEPEWTWTETDDGFVVTAKFICSECGLAETILAEVDEVVVDAVCEADGSDTYTAAVEFQGKEYTDTKVIVLLALNHAYGEPVWSWNELGTAAQAKFVCANDPAHVVEIAAEMSGELNEEGVLMTAKVEFENEEYSDTKVAPVCASVFGTSMTLGELFSANVYLELNPAVLADPDAYVALGEVQRPVAEAKATRANGKTIYGFSFDLAPKKFNDEIVVKVCDGDGNVLTLIDLDGALVLDGFVFSAQSFINSSLERNPSEKYEKLLVALNDLGSYAQTFFGYNGEAIAPIMGDVSGVKAADLKQYAGTVKSNSELVKVVGQSMLLSDNMKIRHYVKLNGVEAEDLVFQINGVEVEPGKNNNGVYFETANVPAKLFGQMYTFQILDGEGNELYHAEYCVYSYVYSMLTKPQSKNLTNLLKALVVYGQAAEAYFA